MKIDVISIFPEYLQPLRLSLVGKAIENGIVDLGVHDLRQWTHDRHRTVDDTPYGGGAGMVMRPEPWGEALDELAPVDHEGVDHERIDHDAIDHDAIDHEGAARPGRLLIMTPAGRPFTQRLADELATEDHLIFACGRYEGVDARVAVDASRRMRTDEVSIGDYVLNGGEVAALVIIEAVVRLLPGVIGNPESLAEESHAAGHDQLLEYPLYTKPPSWRGLDVPEILFSGHHAKIAAWRREQAERVTRERRPDLLAPEEVIIEPAKGSDAGEILTLQRAAFVAEARLNGSVEIPALTEPLDGVRTAIENNTVLVARHGDRIVGSVVGNADHADGWYIGRLVVAPDRQGEGIGSRLLGAAEAAARAGTTVFRLVTGGASDANIGLYQRRGYSLVGRGADSSGTAIVYLEKRLPDPLA